MAIMICLADIMSVGENVELGWTGRDTMRGGGGGGEGGKTRGRNKWKHQHVSKSKRSLGECI